MLFLRWNFPVLTTPDATPTFIPMKNSNDVAFKESAIVCQALEEGKQTLVLRKGGVMEEGGVLKPEHDEFFIYPTYDPNVAEGIKADWRPRIHKLDKDAKDTKHVHFRIYATVDSVLKVTNWEAAKSLVPFTVLTEQAIEKEFRSSDWEGFYLFLLRVYSLAVPMDLPRKASHDKPSIFVPLGASLFTIGAFPVIPEGAWPYTRDKIHKMVQ